MNVTRFSLAAPAIGLVFVALVYAALRIAHVSEPAATTVHGATLPRLWATAAAVLAIVNVIISALASTRSTGQCAGPRWRLGTVRIGIISAINGGLVLALADGGPGSGNGVVGGAAALALGLVAIPLGSLHLLRSGASG